MCEIRGRITDKETGQPIARAVVHITTDSGKTRLTTRTDDEGLYRFSNLAPGAYTGSVEPAALSATHIGTSIGPARILLLKSGDVRSDVNVALVPALEELECGWDEVRAMIHPDDLPSFGAMIARAMTGVDVTFAFRIMTERGTLQQTAGTRLRLPAT